MKTDKTISDSSMPGTSTLRQVALFGGALETTIPREMDDVSQIRQVPDNQEVFVEGGGQKSVIIEMLELEPTGDRLKFHWNEIVQANQALRNEIILTSPTRNTTQPVAGLTTIESLVGVQVSGKFNKEEVDLVLIYLGLIQWSQFDTEILVTYHVPLQHSIDVHQVEELIARAKTHEATEETQVFTAILESVLLKDPSIFG